MLDHVGIEVSDLARSKAFYEAALEPLGIKLLMEFEGAAGYHPGYYGAFVLDPDANNVEAVCHRASQD